MRLLRVPSVESGYDQLEMKEFFGSAIPPYAILSHTWSDDEILFQDIESRHYHQRAAYQKLRYTLQQSRRDGYDWAWIDTCCIDKSSSAELQEAINSMFVWYQRSSFCYVFLADVKDKPKSDLLKEAFVKSRWFTRGWTLQELLAPKRLSFFNQAWEDLGRIDRRREKGQHTFESHENDRQMDWSRPVEDYVYSFRDLTYWVSLATTASVSVIRGTADIEQCSIRERLSWASGRTTTREEDEAYCLLGIFDVAMPLLYGEGSRAFIRLQEDIMKRSDDTSLLYWKDPAFAANEGTTRSFLAPSPDCFKFHPATSHDGDKYGWLDLPPYAMTNKGLQITLPLIRIFRDVYLAVLFTNPQGGWGGVYLLHLQDDTMARTIPGRVGFVRAPATMASGQVSTPILVRRDHVVEYSFPDGLPVKIHDRSSGYRIVQVLALGYHAWNMETLWPTYASENDRRHALAQWYCELRLGKPASLILTFEHLLDGEKVVLTLGCESDGTTVPTFGIGIANKTNLPPVNAPSDWVSSSSYRQEVVGYRPQTHTAYSRFSQFKHEASVWATEPYWRLSEHFPGAPSVLSQVKHPNDRAIKIYVAVSRNHRDLVTDPLW